MSGYGLSADSMTIFGSLRNHVGYDDENVTLKYELSYSKIIPSCLYYTIWAKCPKTGMVRTDLRKNTFFFSEYCLMHVIGFLLHFNSLALFN